jgi:hypothetical protein
MSIAFGEEVKGTVTKKVSEEEPRVKKEVSQSDSEV